jgi:hypothetical protein
MDLLREFLKWCVASEIIYILFPESHKCDIRHIIIAVAVFHYMWIFTRKDESLKSLYFYAIIFVSSYGYKLVNSKYQSDMLLKIQLASLIDIITHITPFYPYQSWNGAGRIGASIGVIAYTYMLYYAFPHISTIGSLMLIKHIKKVIKI